MFKSLNPNSNPQRTTITNMPDPHDNDDILYTEQEENDGIDEARALLDFDFQDEEIDIIDSYLEVIKDEFK